VRIVLTTILAHETEINEEVKDQIIPKTNHENTSVLDLLEE